MSGPHVVDPKAQAFLQPIIRPAAGKPTQGCHLALKDPDVVA